jgi:hypothetical protein
MAATARYFLAFIRPLSRTQATRATVLIEGRNVGPDELSNGSIVDELVWTNW